MMTMAGLLAATAAMASPVATVTSVTQAADLSVTVTYTLADGPAVVTMDVETKDANGVWKSIGGENVSGRCPPSGDVFKRVTGEGPHSFVWDPDFAWPGSDFVAGSDNVRITVRAWAMDDTPDYMAVRLSSNETERVAWYPAAEYVPGGVLSNVAYRTGTLLMRRIHAKDVTWTMGTTNGKLWWIANHSPAHPVTLDHDYYIGVFQLTIAQLYAVNTQKSLSQTYGESEGLMRPADGMSYGVLREGNLHTAVDPDHEWPNPPAETSIIAKFRKRLICAEFPQGLDIELPSEAEWEYACKAGVCNEMYWNNGALIGNDAGNADVIPGRCKGNQAVNATFHSPTVGPTNATAVCGSYAPNPWGLYDMHGNLWETCLDWYADDITALNGAVNAKGEYLADGTTKGEQRVSRGGSWREDSYASQSEFRQPRSPSDTGYSSSGVRFACRAGLK